MKLLKTLLPAMAFTAAAMTAPSTLAAQWNMPTPYGDANLPTQIAYGFAEDIKESTGGELDIKVHSGASLIKHPEIPRAVRTGQVQLGEVFIGIMVIPTLFLSTTTFLSLPRTTNKPTSCGKPPSLKSKNN